MKTVLSRLVAIRNENVEVLDSAPHAAAAAAMVPSFLNGAVGVRLPDHEAWVKAYQADPETKLLLSFVHDPSLVTVKSI